MNQIIQDLRKNSFLQQRRSVQRGKSFEANKSSTSTKGNLTKKPSFVTYCGELGNDHDSKLQLVEVNEEFNEGPANDRPPTYLDVTENKIPAPPPPPFSSAYDSNKDKGLNFSQDFTALRDYLVKKLSVKPKLSSSNRDSFMETTRVFEFLQELPEGNNLEEFLGVYGIPIEDVNLHELKEKLKMVFQDTATNTIDNNQNALKNSGLPAWKQQMKRLEELSRDDNLEKWIESLDVPFFNTLPETKTEIRNYLQNHSKTYSKDDENKIDKEAASLSPPNTDNSCIGETVHFSESTVNGQNQYIPKWKMLIDRMRELKDNEELEKWLDGLDVPHNVPKEKAKAEIRKFFLHETWESYKGKSIIYKEGTVANKLWQKFEDSNVLTKVAVTAATTVAFGVVLALGATLLSFAVPGVFFASPFFTEVFSEFFVQRQEVAFNLLVFHAENAKPMSTAWANQFVLWKYF